MLPGQVVGAVDGYVESLKRIAGGQLAAVYAVGSLALSDFSRRQSNVDLVVVTDPPAGGEKIGRMRREERRLQHAGRPATVWYATWQEIADAPIRGQAARFDTPMTRALLRQDPLALMGPDWPVVGYDQAGFSEWCGARLRALAARKKGLLVLRRAVTPLVLEASRLAEGAITGRMLSKSEAGEAVGALVAPRYRRILTDSVGYRRGAQFSMYWGPFERKYDALVLIDDLVEAAAA